MVARILRRSGYEILEARTSSDAVSICETVQSRVDLILSDFNLPGANGLELAKRLGLSHFEVPFMFMSGNCEACDKIVEQGYLCLRKPFSFNDLEETVREILSEHQPFSTDPARCT